MTRIILAALVGVLVCGTTLSLPIPAAAGFDEGYTALKQGDYATALQEFRPLAEQGNAKAQYSLGLMYYKGQGVPQVPCSPEASPGQCRNLILAHMWINLAASRFPPGKDRDMMVERRGNTAEFMTPAQITEAQKLAREWMAKHRK